MSAYMVAVCSYDSEEAKQLVRLGSDGSVVAKEPVMLAVHLVDSASCLGPSMGHDAFPADCLAMLGQGDTAKREA